MEIGDAFWIAKPKRGGPAYSLDTIIERKRVDDLVASIKDQRYERQKYYLARCGIKRTMYVLEGNIDLTVQVCSPGQCADMFLGPKATFSNI